MKSVKKKKTKSNNKKFIIYILGGLVIVLVCLLCLNVSNLIKSNNKSFSVVSRVDDVKSAQSKDNKFSKTVGWIRVQGTNIDYPVYYAPGTDLGSVTGDFAWTEADFKDLNNIVYISGHNIKNLSSTPLITDENHTRFEQLMSFVYYDFAKDNQYIQYTFNGVDYVYKIFSISFESYLHFDNFNTERYSDDRMKKLIDDVKNDSFYDYDNIDVNEKDNLIVLDTCTRMFKDDKYVHLRVVGKLVDNKKLLNSKVVTNKNYEEIEKIVKGGDSYEEA